jgi:hypothetical protein
LRARRDGGAHVTLTIPGARWDEVVQAGDHEIVVVPADPEENPS